MTLGSLKIVGAFTNAPIRMVYGDGVYVSNDAEEAGEEPNRWCL
jgi:hypothetical protein